GAQNTVAFFEWDGVDVDTESVVKAAGIPPTFPTQFDHISFNLPDEDALVALADRLTDFSVEVTDIVDHGIMKSVYFTDPNGIALEASYWVVDTTGREMDCRTRPSSPTRTPLLPCASWPPAASSAFPRPTSSERRSGHPQSRWPVSLNVFKAGPRGP